MVDETAQQDIQFVEQLIKAIVDHPDEVKVNRKVDEMGVLLTLSVNPEDMGKVIGKEGQTAKAIRTLLRVYGAKTNARLNFKILEPEGSSHQPAASTDRISAKPEKETGRDEEDEKTTPLEEKATEVV